MPGGRGGSRNKSGHGKSGEAKVPLSREETVSRAMSYILRHGAEKEKLKLDEGGYIDCAALILEAYSDHLPPNPQLNWHRLSSLNVTFPELRSIVATNSKQRFALIPNPNSPTKSYPSDWLIRATQGHSLPIASSALLTPLLPIDEQCPETAVHGTLFSNWKKILQTGALKKMGRQHIHFAMGVPSSLSSKNKLVTKSKSGGASAAIDLDDSHDREEAEDEVDGEQVISGMRSGADTLIWVDVKRSAEEGGIRWWRSENGVVLTEGDEKGEVALKWVSRVERRETREVIWRPDERGE
ncbi:MAG: hypothetical protein Q9225_007691 [Loekoesia sp. 1 TL-2023]